MPGVRTAPSHTPPRPFSAALLTLAQRDYQVLRLADRLVPNPALGVERLFLLNPSLSPSCTRHPRSLPFPPRLLHAHSDTCPSARCSS